MINPIIRSTVLDQNLKLLLVQSFNAKVLEIIGSKHAVLDIDGKSDRHNETNLFEGKQIKVPVSWHRYRWKVNFRIVNQGSSGTSDELFILNFRSLKSATPSLISKIKVFAYNSSNIKQILLLV